MQNDQEAAASVNHCKSQAPKPYRDWYDKLILILVVLGFLAAAAAAVFSYRQADISREALEVTKATSRAQIRPYVAARVFSEMWGVDEKSSPNTRVDLFNGGVTPALNVSVALKIAISANPPRFDQFDSIPEILKIPVIQTNNSTPELNIVRLDKPLSEPDRQDVERGRRKIYLWGKITYEDVLGDVHQTFVCYSFHGIKPYTNQIPAADNGLRAGNRRACANPDRD